MRAAKKLGLDFKWTNAKAIFSALAYLRLKLLNKPSRRLPRKLLGFVSSCGKVHYRFGTRNKN